MKKAFVALSVVFLFLFAARAARAEIQYPDLTGTTITLPYNEFGQTPETDAAIQIGAART